MTFEDVIVVAILLLLAGGISLYIFRQKKKGNKCIGCPHGKSCTGACTCMKNENE